MFNKIFQCTGWMIEWNRLCGVNKWTTQTGTVDAYGSFLWNEYL